MNASNCVICGKTLSGGYFTTEQNERFCRNHTDPPRCRFCLHLLKNGESEPCARCRQKGFRDIQHAQGSISRVLRWLEDHIGSHQFHQVPIKLTEGAHFGPTQAGLTNWSFNGQHLNVHVEMLRYAQANTFEPTLAHEYGHVLLIANPLDLSFTGGVGQTRLQEEEGFCEVLRYLWIDQAGASNKHLEMKAIMDNANSLYGDGFRMMWPAYQAAGSVMNLRADLLGIPRPLEDKYSSAASATDQKYQPSVQPQQILPMAIPQADPQQLQTVIEGGSHRPILTLNLSPSPTTSRPPAGSPSSDEHRPTLDLSLPNVKNQKPLTTKSELPPDMNDERPTIRLD